jgi:iron complex transport system substrate-binding protein
VDASPGAAGPSRRSVLTAAVAVTGAALAGCTSRGAAPTGSASSAGAGGAVTVTDQRGHELRLAAPARRVVTLPMPAASMLVAVDRGPDHLVAMHDASWVAARDGLLGEMFPALLDVPHDVAGQDFAPNVESILALEPDLVVQWGDEGTEITAPLEQAGLPVLGLSYGTQADLEAWITLFAEVLGKPERGQQMNARLRGELARARAAGRAQTGPAPSVLYFNRFAGGLKVAAQDTYNDFYIALVGATNPATGPSGVPGGGMVAVDPEQVLAWDPDVVLLGNFDAAVPQDLYVDPLWQNLSAVQSRRVYKVPLGGYRWDPPGQESPLMWRWLARIAFPSPEPSDLRQVVAEHYDFLYGRRPTAEQLDAVLQTEANAASADYGQFDAA